MDGDVIASGVPFLIFFCRYFKANHKCIAEFVFPKTDIIVSQSTR